MPTKTKKAAKKPNAKKQSVKRTPKAKSTKAVKRTTKNSACGCKKKCLEGKAFWINNGPIVHSLEELTQALKHISDEQYAYHAKRDGNDFAKWIHDCFSDGDCAAKMQRARTRIGAARVLSNKCACK